MTWNSSGASAGSALKTLALQAATPAAGFPLVNGTPVIVSWTAPNDGSLHVVEIFFDIVCYTAQTGGAVSVNGEAPDGTPYFWQISPGAQAAGYVYYGTAMTRTLKAGQTISVAQSTAQTGGAATVWASIWGC